jgi:glycosidase
VKGKAGSPYAIKDYYDIDPDLADNVNNRMAEFESLVDRTHKAGLKVIMDFVPNHVAREYYSDSKPSYIEDLGHGDNKHISFSAKNNFYYIPNHPLQIPVSMLDEDIEYSEFPAKATGNDQFTSFPSKSDWYETVKLNYGVDYVNGHSTHFDPIPDTWTKMLDILLFWASKGVDGFRCDMAEMVPVEFWNWVIPQVKKRHYIVFIAEIYNPYQYKNYIENGHFDYLYDKVGLYDTLRAVMTGQTPASNITYCWQSVEGIQHNMVNFLENHDEQRIASRYFASDPKLGIPGIIVAALMNTNPVLIYSGQELGEKGEDSEGFSGLDGRTTIFDYWSVDTLRRWNDNGRFDEALLSEDEKRLRATYTKILNIAKYEAAIRDGEFYDLTYANIDNQSFDTSKMFVFLRKHKNEVLLIVSNFGTEKQEAKINIPAEALRYLQIEDNAPAKLENLLTGEKSVGTLTAFNPYEIEVDGCSGIILKFSYQ